MPQATTENLTQIEEAIEPAIVDIEHADPETLKAQIDAISSDKWKALLKRDQELIAEIDRLTSLRGQGNALEMAEAELINVRAELAKRGEDLSSTSAAIAAHADLYGTLAVDAYKDTKEDTAKRKAAQNRLARAREAVGAAKSKLAALDLDNPESQSSKDRTKLAIELEDVKKAFHVPYIWDNSSAIADATAPLTRFDNNHPTHVQKAKDELTRAETEVEEAEKNIFVVAEQIEIDKRERVRKMDLVENHEFVVDLVSRSLQVIDPEIGEYEAAIISHNKSLSGAIKKRGKISADLRTAQETLAQKQREATDINKDLEDFTDRTDPDYLELSDKVDTLSREINELGTEVGSLEGDFTNMDVAVKQCKSSIGSMTMLKRLAERSRNKFRMIERMAEDIGESLPLIVKGVNRAGINESLDKGANAMTLAVARVARQVEIAAAKEITDMTERTVALLDELEDIGVSADNVLAAEAKRYDAVAEKMRTGYGSQGADIENMSHLAEAAALLKGDVAQEEAEAKEDDYY